MEVRPIKRSILQKRERVKRFNTVAFDEPQKQTADGDNIEEDRMMDKIKTLKLGETSIEFNEVKSQFLQALRILTVSVKAEINILYQQTKEMYENERRLQ